MSNSSFNNSPSSILSPLTIETPCPVSKFNITERPTTTGTLLVDTPRNLLHPTTASPTNEAVGNMLETIEYNSMTGLEVILLVKYEKKLKEEELHCKNKIINTLLEIIEKFGDGRRNTQSVPPINFKNGLTTSPNKDTDSKTDPKLDEQQQSHDNKQSLKRVVQRNYAKTVKEKGVIRPQMRQCRINLRTLKRKRKEYYKYKQSVCSDAGEKDKSVNNDQ